MSNSVELKDDELASNVRKVCFALLIIFITTIGFSLLGFNIPDKIKNLAAFLAFPASILLNASYLPIWIKK